MKKIVFLLLFPLWLFSQSYENWITPFATVEFEEDIIIYKYGVLSPVCALEPEFLFTDHIKLSPDPVLMTGCKEIHDGMELLRQYLLNPENPKNDRNDKLRYLKAFALQTILSTGGNGLPSEVLLEKIKIIAISPDKKISQFASITIDFYQSVENHLFNSNGHIDYLTSPISSGFVPKLFSEELIPQNSKEYLNPKKETWPKYYGYPDSYDYSDDIIESYDNGYLMSGNVYTVGQETTQWSWLIKTDVNGDTLWTKVITNEQKFIRTFAIDQTSDGGYILCGLAYINQTTKYPYVMKLDACMEKVWCKLLKTIPGLKILKKLNQGI